MLIMTGFVVQGHILLSNASQVEWHQKTHTFTNGYAAPSIKSKVYISEFWEKKIQKFICKHNV